MNNQIINIIKDFKMTKYEDLPSFDLYVDQLIQIVQEELKPFFLLSNSQKLTTSMVNNYVKSNVMDKPIKKKYNKEQLSTLILITSLKSVFSIDEIDQFIKQIINNEDFQNSYNKFCISLETSIKNLFLNNEYKVLQEKNSIDIIVNAVVSKLYTQLKLELLKGDFINEEFR